MELKMRCFLLVALATAVLGQFNLMGPNSVEDFLFDGTARTRDMYVLTPAHRIGAGPDGLLTIYLSTRPLNFFADVGNATAEGPGDEHGPKRVWESMSDTCEPGKGFRYKSTDPFYPFHVFYDRCGFLTGFQVYIRGPTDAARTTTSAELTGGVQHYDPDGTWLQDFRNAGTGGPFVETVFQFTGDRTVAFPGHEEVRHHTIFIWFRNHTKACDICINDGSQSFYTDRMAIGFKLQAGTTPLAPHIQKFLIDGSYHGPVKFFEYGADRRNGDRSKSITPFGYFDHGRCVPFMGVHLEPAVVPPWMGVQCSFTMYGPDSYLYTGFELDIQLLQEFGNRALEPEMYGKGGPVMDPSHNSFEPWNPAVTETEYCAPGQWGPVPIGPGYPVSGVPGLSAANTTTDSQFSYYSMENWCRNPNIPSPHSSVHFYFGLPLLYIKFMCPTPLTFQTQANGMDGGTDYTYRPIDGYREPFSPFKGPYAVPPGVLFDTYLRFTQTSPVANPENRHYYYHWLDGYEGHVDYCHNVAEALGFSSLKGGGQRKWRQFGPWSFAAEPADFCVMLQNLVEGNPQLSGIFDQFGTFNMKDLPALPRPRRISNALFKNPQVSSKKFLNMLQVYFGMYTVFDSMNFARDLQDFIYVFLEKCDPDKDPLCECCTYEETLDLSNLQRCFYDKPRCVQVDFRAQKTPGSSPLVDWYVFQSTSDTNPRESAVLATQMLDLSQIYDVTLYELNRFVRNGPYIFEQETFLTNFLFYFGQFRASLQERGGRLSDANWNQRGDIRNNKNCASRAIGDVFVRNHNRLVAECLRGNIGCANVDVEDDWVVFNMARRWNIAQYQRVVFREYVPSILGIPLREYDRNADGLAYTRNLQQYNKTTIPKITLEFSLAYRNGHTKIRDFLSRKNSFLDDVETIPVTGNHNNMSCLFNLETGERREGVMEQIIYGLVSDLSTDHGMFMADATRNTYNYQPSTGLDLVVWNTVRGRDTGLPPFNKVREAYGLAPYASCDDLTSDKSVVQQLNSLYGEEHCIDRIDFFVACMAEDITQNQATVGPTSWAIFFDQYNRLRNGDRYYYENQLSADVASNLGFEFGLLTSDSYNPIPFSNEDIDEIFQANFESIIAANSDVKVGELGNNLFFVKNRQLQTLAIDGNLVAGNFEDPEGFENKIALSSTVTLWWKVEDNDITIRYQSLTPGWLGYGIGADPGTMRNGDIHFCSVDDFTGIGLITDRFALDVGPPQHDVDLGGTDDSFNQITRQVDGSTICQFTRALDTKDPFDHPYLPGFTKTLFAFNPFTDEEVYHGPTRKNGIDIDYYFQFPVDELHIIIIIAFGVNGALGILYCVFTLIVIAMKPDYFRFMSPLFCQLICVGSIIAFSSVFPLMKDPPSEHSCMAYPWLLGLGFTLAFSCLFAKTWRLWRLFSRKSLKAKVIDNNFLLQIVAVFMFVIIVLLIVWTSDVGMTVDRDFTDAQQNEIRFLCDTETVYWGIFAGLFAASLLGGCILTFLIRNLPQEYNDAEAIGMSIYNSTLMLVAGAAIGWGLDDNTNAVSSAKGFTVLVAFWFLTLVLFGPTHFRIFVTKKEPQTFKSTMAMGSGGSGVSGLTSGSTNS